MKMQGVCAAILSMATAANAAVESGPFDFDFQEIEFGVWVGVRDDSPRFPVMGNTTFVMSEEGVVVFDGGGMPTMAEQIISKVRSLTDKPVTHVVISHWHGDHSFGAFRFAEEYPDVQFIAHRFTSEVFNSTRISYIDRQAQYIEDNLDEFKTIAATGVNSEGEAQSEADRQEYKKIVAHASDIKAEFRRARITQPNVLIDDRHTIQSGDRTIELLHLGHANTAGDIVMWLPEERIVSTGDIVVLPSPYAFNVPPRAWAATLREINKLEYSTLVPGHGEIQRDSQYVDLIIEMAESVADQRDEFLTNGLSEEEIEASLDFSEFEDRFTHGDEYVKGYYDAYFEIPFRKAAMKALTGEPMVEIEPPERVPFSDDRWQIEAQELEHVEHLGQQALRIRGGAAVLPDLDIRNGLVEFDIAVTEERGFAGLVFRLQDQANYEHFYIRPHQSGKPDANQYNPVINGVSAWQLYHGEGYSAPVEYRYGEWMHVKVIFAGSKAKVFIDSDEPVLHINDLKRNEMGGAIGVNSANFSSVHFANFKMTPLADAYTIPSTGPGQPASAAGLVTSWQVSNAFDSSLLEGAVHLPAELKATRNWSELGAEPSGITNLAWVQGLVDGRNTVFARLVVDADKPGKKRLSFGYSDASAVFVNDNLVYRGDNSYRSRDYRYLGTIGMFDNVVLPLQKGANEIWIAVSESFGGWGIMASITDFAETR